MKAYYKGQIELNVPTVKSLLIVFCNSSHLPFYISGFDDLNLTTNTDMATVVKAMASPDSGLEIRDRMWLKITIPNAFIGQYTKDCAVV